MYLCLAKVRCGIFRVRAAYGKPSPVANEAAQGGMNMCQTAAGRHAVYLEGKERGCLLLHDVCGGAEQMRWLGEQLNRRGYTVCAPEWEACGETFHFPRASNWRKWLDSARQAYAGLRTHCEAVSVLGAAGGGALAVILAEEYPVERLVLASPEMWPDVEVGGAGRWARGCMMRRARENLFAVVAPTLVLRFEGERAGGERGAKRVLSGISSAERRMVWLNGSIERGISGRDGEILLRTVIRHIDDTNSLA